MRKPPKVIYTMNSVSIEPTNTLDRPFAYEAVLIVGDTECLLSAQDCLVLGEQLVAIAESKADSPILSAPA